MHVGVEQPRHHDLALEVDFAPRTPSVCSVPTPTIRSPEIARPPRIAPLGVSTRPF